MTKKMRTAVMSKGQVGEISLQNSLLVCMIDISHKNKLDLILYFQKWKKNSKQNQSEHPQWWGKVNTSSCQCQSWDTLSKAIIDSNGKCKVNIHQPN